MQKISVELSSKEAEELADQLLERLEPAAKLRLTEKLAREARRSRWESLVLTMRRRTAHRPLSARAIRRLCETVRQEHFERRQCARRQTRLDLA